MSFRLSALVDRQLLVLFVQAHKVKVEFHKGGVDHTYMRVDGEPWLQNLPPDDKPTVMEITHKGQAVALAYGKCVSKPIPKAVAEEAKLPISTASFNSVQDTGSSQSSMKRTSLRQTKSEEVAAKVFLREETPAAEETPASGSH